MEPSLREAQRTLPPEHFSLAFTADCLAMCQHCEQGRSPAHIECYHTGRNSDVVIRYGTDGSQVFNGHRKYLCAGSEWFKNALEGGLKEAQDNEIHLLKDNPRAIEAMLEYMYTKNYTPDVKGSTPDEAGQYEILQWLHIIVIADKFIVHGLVDKAIHNIASYFEKNTEKYSFSTFAFVVEAAWGVGDVFDNEDEKEVTDGQTEIKQPRLGYPKATSFEFEIGSSVAASVTEWGELTDIEPFQPLQQKMLDILWYQFWGANQEDPALPFIYMAWCLGQKIPDFWDRYDYACKTLGGVSWDEKLGDSCYV